MHLGCVMATDRRRLNARHVPREELGDVYLNHPPHCRRHIL